MATIMKTSNDEEVLEKFEDHPFERMRFDGKHCFLCGDLLGAEMTEEHVFPKWLQNQFNLWNKKVTLLNGTTMPYRSLTVPCCVSCNGTYLSQLENQIRAAVEVGYEAVVELDKTKLFLWLAKIVYAIKFKELFLKLDRKDSNNSLTIMTKDYLEGSYALHVMLQGVWKGIDFETSVSGHSVLVVNLHLLKKLEFNFADNLHAHTICLQLGDVGIIAALQDFDVTAKTYGRYVDAVDGRKLHPIQFDELFAKVTYQSLLIENVPFYQFVVDKNVSLPIRVFVLNNPHIREWNQEEYFDFFRSYMRVWGEKVKLEFHPPDKVTTFMADEYNNLRLVKADGSLIDISE